MAEHIELWVTDDGLATEHQRDDIIARIKRGDFGK